MKKILKALLKKHKQQNKSTIDKKKKYMKLLFQQTNNYKFVKKINKELKNTPFKTKRYKLYESEMSNLKLRYNLNKYIDKQNANKIYKLLIKHNISITSGIYGLVGLLRIYEQLSLYKCTKYTSDLRNNEKYREFCFTLNNMNKKDASPEEGVEDNAHIHTYLKSNAFIILKDTIALIKHKSANSIDLSHKEGIDNVFDLIEEKFELRYMLKNEYKNMLLHLISDNNILKYNKERIITMLEDKIREYNIRDN